MNARMKLLLAALTAGMLIADTIPAGPLRFRSCWVKGLTADDAVNFYQPEDQLTNAALEYLPFSTAWTSRDYARDQVTIVHVLACAEISPDVLRFERDLEQRERRLFLWEQLHIEQLCVFRCLIRHYDVKTIYCGGLKTSQIDRFKAHVRATKELGENLPAYYEEYHERKVLAILADDHGIREENSATVEQLERLFHEYRISNIRIGAAWDLYRSGLIETPVALEPEAGLPDKDRANAIAARLLSADTSLVVVLLDGRIDLTDALGRQSDRCRYVRVTPEDYPQLELK